MNRRALLSAFLAAPVAVKLGRWWSPAPFTVVDGWIFVSPEGNLQAALDYASSQGGGKIYIRPGHYELSGAIIPPAGITLAS
jgi:hypothetical protein